MKPRSIMAALSLSLLSSPAMAMTAGGGETTGWTRLAEQPLDSAEAMGTAVLAVGIALAGANLIPGFGYHSFPFKILAAGAVLALGAAAPGTILGATP